MHISYARPNPVFFSASSLIELCPEWKGLNDPGKISSGIRLDDETKSILLATNLTQFFSALTVLISRDEFSTSL